MTETSFPSGHTASALKEGDGNTSLLTPELLFKMNKKIAQLTKVVYGLNTRGEELEGQLAQLNKNNDVLREANAELQRKTNIYKNKLENDSSAGEAHFYQMECENLRRKLDEVSFGATPHVGSVVGMAALREDLEQHRRREKSMQFEMEQMRQAINTMKSHHEFMLRDRDAQMSREANRVTNEWQARLSELETRYQSQVNALTHEIEVMRCDRQTDRQRLLSEDGDLKEQLTALKFEKENEKREWQLELQKKEHLLDEERIKSGQERREADQKMKQMTEERRREMEAMEESMRSSTKQQEERTKHLQEQIRRLSHSLSQKEAEFSRILENKEAELKIHSDVVEANLRAETLRLKGEIAALQSNQTVDNETKIVDLQNELKQKALDYDLLASNLRMRITVSETEIKNLTLECQNLEKHLKEEKEKAKQNHHRNSLQVTALERHLKDEAERHQFTQSKLEKLNSKVKGELERQLTCLKESEKIIREENEQLISDITEMKSINDGLERKDREKDRIYEDSLQKATKDTEAKIKARLEKSWLEKLKKTEESASQDIIRMKETHKRIEDDLRRELTIIEKGEEETKRLNEEFKKKVRQLRQSESELTDKLAALESDKTNNKKQKDNSSNAAKYKKELASLEAKYTEQLAKLKSALNQKQLEIQKTKEETEKILQEREEKFRSEREELKCKIEQEVNRKEEEEKRIQEEQSKTDEEEKQKEDDYENELEESKRKYDKVQIELLLLKQQNDEFEDIVRDKHRRQMEMELQVDQITKDVEKKQTTIDSLRIELTYSKNESESSKLQLQKLTAELEEVKQKVDTLESEIDNSERELKRMEIMQEKLQVTEKKREELQKQLDDIEIERDDEIKIIQDALDEAAQEREELLDTFEKEVERINTLNAEREKEMLAEFEKKLRELEKEHNKRLAEKDKVRENSLARTKREEEEMKIKLEKIKNNLNSEWEDKIGKERCRVMAELATLHNDEKSTALESLKIQKENEMKSMKQTLDSKANELSKEVSSLKDKLTSKDSFYRQELDDMRTRSDRDVWELRRKLQRLDETTYEKQQLMEDKHREELERLKEEYQDKIKGLESQLSSVDVKGITELRTKLEKSHREAMENMNDQHKLSMERLREELDAEKFQAVEDTRVIVTKHHEYVNTTLRDQLTEAITANTQYREEIDAIRFALSRREEVIKSLEDDISLLKASRGSLSSSPVPQQVVPPYPGEGGQRNSLERTESTSEDKGSGLLGKVFGGGWFSGNKKENTAPQSNNSGQNKKPR